MFLERKTVPSMIFLIRQSQEKAGGGNEKHFRSLWIARLCFRKEPKSFPLRGFLIIFAPYGSLDRYQNSSLLVLLLRINIRGKNSMFCKLKLYGLM
ncbi:hypothetical protein DQM68_10300 [Leptospira mayottensis]|uniref:DUF1564 family protein n=1 Tax=Leptospira mayottensis TaxID=1137606 RepID=A0ABM6YCE8_9LEPT|nr:hypothetical protein DQM68_10300 [Leptospira mayottensis]AXR65724.1 hypothetical protein DQM28_17445 [Leptospira mayottensis]AZQ02546.1 hypothetical protein LEP1GSC190_11390 [Leptospira mayottensis 200901116]TGM96867.1 hypothetical protein EHR03_15300 [Leptospira mayottensis]